MTIPTSLYLSTDIPITFCRERPTNKTNAKPPLFSADTTLLSTKKHSRHRPNNPRLTSRRSSYTIYVYVVLLRPLVGLGWGWVVIDRYSIVILLIYFYLSLSFIPFTLPFLPIYLLTLPTYLIYLPYLLSALLTFPPIYVYVYRRIILASLRQPTYRCQPCSLRAA